MDEPGSFATAEARLAAERSAASSEMPLFADGPAADP
jgi:hypothetical protein